MSQKTLGEKLGVSQQTIAQYEKAIDTPKISTVQKLANALEIQTTLLIPTLPRIDLQLFSGDTVDSSIEYAHFDSKEYTKEELAEIKQFAEFIKYKRTPKD